MTIKTDSRDSARLKMSKLMLHRLPLCIGVSAIFGSVLAYVWQELLSSWQFISWCIYLIAVSLINLALEKYCISDDSEDEISDAKSKDIDRLTMVVAVSSGLAWFLASVIQYNNPLHNSWLYLSILLCIAASSGVLYCYNIKAALIVVSMTLVPCFIEILPAWI